MATFKTLVKAVEENNRINDAKWGDWQDAIHIQSVYGFLNLDEYTISSAFLNSMIKDEGLNKEILLNAYEVLMYGYAFAR